MRNNACYKLCWNFDDRCAFNTITLKESNNFSFIKLTIRICWDFATRILGLPYIDQPSDCQFGADCRCHIMSLSAQEADDDNSGVFMAKMDSARNMSNILKAIHFKDVSNDFPIIAHKWWAIFGQSSLLGRAPKTVHNKLPGLGFMLGLG